MMYGFESSLYEIKKGKRDEDEKEKFSQFSYNSSWKQMKRMWMFIHRSSGNSGCREVEERGRHLSCFTYVSDFSVYNKHLFIMIHSALDFQQFRKCKSAREKGNQKIILKGIFVCLLKSFHLLSAQFMCGWEVHWTWRSSKHLFTQFHFLESLKAKCSLSASFSRPLSTGGWHEKPR